MGLFILTGKRACDTEFVGFETDFVWIETSAGYALLKAKGKKIVYRSRVAGDAMRLASISA